MVRKPLFVGRLTEHVFHQVLVAVGQISAITHEVRVLNELVHAVAAFQIECE